MSASSGYGGGSPVPPGPSIETLTGNVGGAVGPTAGNIDILGSGPLLTTGNPGTSTITISLNGTVATQYDEDVGSAVPIGGILIIEGGPSTAGGNINTAGATNHVQVILNDSLVFPNTNTTGTEGVLYWGGNRFIHNYGAGGTNTFVGSNAGNLTYGGPGRGSQNTGIGQGALTSLVASGIDLGGANTAIGSDCLRSVTDGSWNCAMGNAAGSSITTGQGNCIIGNSAASNLTTGNTNILIGGDDNISPGVGAAGDNYTTESSNICLQNPGVIGDNQVMRLGDDGVVDGKINSTYIAGVYNRAFASPSGVVQIDSNFKVGSSAGTDGQLLIGDTGASPVWANLASAGGTVVITNLAGGINLEATGVGGGASSFPADIGTAVEAGGFLNILGGPSTAGTNIFTTGAGNTIEIALNDSILLPNTNALGDGIIYLGGQQFISNYGSGNTFIGNSAANLTLTTISAVDNTAIGDNCLPALTVSPSNTFVGSNSGTLLASGLGLNTAVGFAVMDNLVSGTNNIALGTLAATNYTTNESNNIIIGSFGTIADQDTIRIGRTQTAAYMEGIYNQSIGTTNAPVYIDNTGKLGTMEAGVSLAGSSFMAVVTGLEILPSSGSQTYLLGTNLVETILWDDFGSAFYPGDGVGTPANFTAPIDGRYEFKWNFLISIISVSSLNIEIYVNGVLNLYSQKQKYSTTGAGNFSGTFYVSSLLTLSVGDIVTFGTTFTGSAINPIRFLGQIGPDNTSLTWVSGTLLKTT